MALFTILELIFFVGMFPVAIVLSIVEGIFRIVIGIIFKAPFNEMFFLKMYSAWGDEFKARIQRRHLKGE